MGQFNHDPGYKICDIKRAMFLILVGNIPTRVRSIDGRTEYTFDSESRPYNRLWSQMITEVLTAIRAGVPHTPEQLDSLQYSLWEELNNTVGVSGGSEG